MPIIQISFEGKALAIPEQRVPQEAKDIPEYKTGLTVNLVDENRRIVACNSCAALCCRAGVRLPLHEPEAESLKQAGTQLRMVEPAPVPRRRLLPILGTPRRKPALYEMETDCGNKGVWNGCKIYGEEVPKRPEICSTFMPGSYLCRKLRYHGLIDTPEQWAAYLILNTKEP